MKAAARAWLIMHFVVLMTVDTLLLFNWRRDITAQRALPALGKSAGIALRIKEVNKNIGVFPPCVPK